MTFDSFTLLASTLLLTVSLFAWRNPGRGRGYLRFAATLFAALAIAVLVQFWIPGLGDAVARIVLPLGGVGLALYALCRHVGRVPQFFATLCLVAALAVGLDSLLRDDLAAAFIVLALGGAVTLIVGIGRASIIAILAGALLIAAACAFTVAGAGMATLALLAASLFGLGL